MKQLLVKIIVLLLCLNFGSFGVTAQTQGASLTVLKAEVSEAQMEVTCHITGQVSQITYLVYTLTETGDQEALVHAGELAGGENEVLTFPLTVPLHQTGYLLCVGGTWVTTPRRVVVSAQGYAFGYLGYSPEQTAEGVKAGLGTPGEIAVTRGETVLEDSEKVTVGDKVIAGEEHYTLVMFGDVNADQKVNASDALQILRHAVKKITLTDTSLAATNWVQDGKIDATDALAVLKFAVGKAQGL